uniref:Uncharacterized protein n=1 Tax=Salix viminalis TaxID=40686 RepID=A0A6N2NCD2_SALVM
MKGHLLISGLGGNMGKNLSKDLLIQGAITGAARQRAVQPRNKWKDAGQILRYSSLLTPQITTIQVLISMTPTRTSNQKISEPRRPIL